MPPFLPLFLWYANNTVLLLESCEKMMMIYLIISVEKNRSSRLTAQIDSFLTVKGFCLSWTIKYMNIWAFIYIFSSMLIIPFRYVCCVFFDSRKVIFPWHCLYFILLAFS